MFEMMFEMITGGDQWPLVGLLVGACRLMDGMCIEQSIHAPGNLGSALSCVSHPVFPHIKVRLHHCNICKDPFVADMLASKSSTHLYLPNHLYLDSQGLRGQGKENIRDAILLD